MTSYTLFSQEAVPGPTADGSPNTIGVKISVSQACTLGGIWFYSGPGLTGLPSELALYKVSDQSLVHSEAAMWSPDTPAAGWTFAAFAAAPVLSPAVNYMPALLCDTAEFDYISEWWNTGPGSAGIVNGPLSAPGASDGQGWYNAGSALAFPGSQFNSCNWWLDPQVTPVPAAPSSFSGLPLITGCM